MCRSTAFTHRGCVAEPVVEDDGEDTAGVDRPAADGGAAAAVGQPAADGSEPMQLAATELPTTEAVLERAGNYAPTSISTDAFGE